MTPVELFEPPTTLVDQLRRGNLVAVVGPGLDAPGHRPGPPQPTASHRNLMRIGLSAILGVDPDGLFEVAHGEPSETGTTVHRYPEHADAALDASIIPLLAASSLLWIFHSATHPGLDPLLAHCRRLGIRGGIAVVPATDPQTAQRLADVAAVLTVPRPADVHRFLRAIALAMRRSVGFTVRFVTDCPNERAGKRRQLDLEELLDDYGVQARIWRAHADARVLQLEAAAPDFRGLADLLVRRDAQLLERLAAIGVQDCDDIDVGAPAPPPPIAPVNPLRRPESRVARRSTQIVALPVAPDAPVVAFAELLEALFSLEELRGWVFRLPDPGLRHELHLEGSLRSVTLHVAEALERRGLITTQLMDSLRSERPFRAAQIEALASRLSPPIDRTADTWDSYTLFCRLLDRDSAWDKLARKCDSKDDPIAFLLHGSPNQHIALFMDRAHRFLDDENKDGVRREHQVFEVLFERDHTRLQTAEEWEAAFRRAMGYGKGRPLSDYLRRSLPQNAIMFLVRGKDAAPLRGLTPSERDALGEFLHTRLPAALATLQAPHRAVRVLVGVEHVGPTPHGDALFDAVDGALRSLVGVERVALTVHFPTLDEVLDSVERFLSDRLTSTRAIWPALRARCTAVFHRHAAAGDARNYRDLADDLYRDLDAFLSDPPAR